MDIHQLKTFVAVAREGSITRASELLHLSQPAISAHIKAIEDALGIPLFERGHRGMSLTGDGQRLLAKAQETITAHQKLLSEAARIKGRPSGRLRLGAGSSTSPSLVGRLLLALAERCPEVEVALKHGTSAEILADIRGGNIDAGFYNEVEESGADLMTAEVSRFGIWVAAPPRSVAVSQPVDWQALAGLPWIYPTVSACCGRTAEHLFHAHNFRPARVINVDRGDLARTLIAGGIGVGLLHADAAEEALQRGEVQLVAQAPTTVRVLFGYLASRAHDPMIESAALFLGGGFNA